MKVKWFLHRLSAFSLGLILCLFLLEFSLRMIGYLETRADQRPERAATDKFRITCIGNSFTYGAGAPKGKSYPEQLARLLNGSGPERFQVFNRGFMNANSSLVAENTKFWFEKDRPHVVFAMVGEPNKWNKYGLLEFRRRTSEGESKDRLSWFEPLRFLKTYRLIELFLNRSESWNQTDAELFSNTFRSVGKMTDKDKLLLGYLWIGALEAGYFRMNELSSEARAEAALMLRFVITREPSNSIALRLLAELLLKRENFTRDFLPAIEAAVAFPHEKFNYAVWRIFRDIQTYQPDLMTARMTELKRSLEAKVSPAKLLEINKFFQVNGPMSLPKASRSEQMFQMLEYHPSHSFSLMQLSKIVPESELPRFTTIAIRALNMNPLTPSSHFINKLLSRLPNQSELKDRLLAQIKLNEERFGFNILPEVLDRNRVEEEWLISDLERIVSAAHAVGARVVFQTYPPLRKGGTRPADHILRKWWNNRQDKEGIELLDVGEHLLQLFGSSTDKEKYYSNVAGPDDQHLNEVGYAEVAKLMLPMVK